MINDLNPKIKLDIEIRHSIDQSQNKKMPSVIIVEKNGDLKSQEYKSLTTDELYKKCSFKKADGFGKVTEWTYSKKGESMITVELWARFEGQANQENKYDFPPPVDGELFFGNCALLARDSNMSIIDLTVEKWNKVYEHLFGGFETLADNEDEDDEEEDELDNIPSSMKTKDGYLKDGFIIEDALEDGANSDDDDDERDDEGGDSDYENGNERVETTTTTDEDENEDEGSENDDSSELALEEYDYSESESESDTDSETSDTNDA